MAINTEQPVTLEYKESTSFTIKSGYLKLLVTMY